MKQIQALRANKNIKVQEYTSSYRKNMVNMI